MKYRQLLFFTTDFLYIPYTNITTFITKLHEYNIDIKLLEDINPSIET